MTKLEKKQLAKFLNKQWIFDTLLEVSSGEKDFKDCNGISSKRAEKLLSNLLVFLNK